MIKTNSIQFFFLFIISLIILADNAPVFSDWLNNKSSYRLVDGWADGIKMVAYFLVSFVIWLTMKYKNGKRDFMFVLFFMALLLISGSLLGIARIVFAIVISLACMIYTIVVFYWIRSEEN
jgi:hypothetical protein